MALTVCQVSLEQNAVELFPTPRIPHSPGRTSLSVFHLIPRGLLHVGPVWLVGVAPFPALVDAGAAVSHPFSPGRVSSSAQSCALLNSLQDFSLCRVSSLIWVAVVWNSGNGRQKERPCETEREPSTRGGCWSVVCDHAGK